LYLPAPVGDAGTGAVTQAQAIRGLGLVNKLSSIFGWLWLRLAVSAKLGLPTSRPAFCFLASLVLAQPKTKPNFFASPYTKRFGIGPFSG
jgi:hypothetical protein